MKSEKNAFVRLCCMVALILAAVLILIFNVLPHIGLSIGGPVVRVLNFVKDIALLLGIAFGAYSFCRGRKGWVITFWIAVVLYLASAVFGLF